MWSPRRFDSILNLLSNRFFLITYLCYRVILAVCVIIELIIYEFDNKIKFTIFVLLSVLSLICILLLFRIYIIKFSLNYDILNRNILLKYLQILTILDLLKTLLYFTFIVNDIITFLTFITLSVTLPFNLGLKYIHNRYYLELVPVD